MLNPNKKGPEKGLNQIIAAKVSKFPEKGKKGQKGLRPGGGKREKHDGILGIPEKGEKDKVSMIILIRTGEKEGEKRPFLIVSVRGFLRGTRKEKEKACL